MEATKKLKKLREEKGTVLLPGAYDCWSAKIIQKMGFDAIYQGGFAASISMLGKPDMGFTQNIEIADLCRRMYDATEMPIIVDADVGWGETLCVQRTVQLLERAGAAGCHIEDQAMPMKCAGMPGLKYISKEAMVCKIKAAVDARKDQDFLIIGRSDVFARNRNYEEVLDRLYAYKEAGADMLIAGGPFSAEQFADMAEKFPYQTCINAGLYPVESYDRPVKLWYDMKVGLLFYPLAGMMAAGGAMQKIFNQIKEGGMQPAYCEENLFGMRELNETVDFPVYMGKEQTFALKEE